MPFQTNDSDTGSLSNGLTDSLIYRLSQVTTLKVSPSTSVIRYKDKEIDPLKIAGELGADVILTGRVMKYDDSLTNSVELIDVRNKTLWGELYDRKNADFLATQRKIAIEIVEKLQIKLTPKDKKGITKKYTDSNEAYQLYLNGRLSLFQTNERWNSTFHYLL